MIDYKCVENNGECLSHIDYCHIDKFWGNRTLN